MLLLNPYRFGVVFATIYNALRKAAAIVLPNNYSAVAPDSTWASVLATVGRDSGKYQFEVVLESGNNVVVGIAAESYTNYTAYLGSASAATSIGAFMVNANGYINVSGSYGNFVWSGPAQAGDVIGVTVDMTTAGTAAVRFYKNGVLAIGGPVSFAAGAEKLYPAVSVIQSNVATIRARGLQYPIAGYQAWDGVDVAYSPPAAPSELLFNPFRKSTTISLTNSNKTATGTVGSWRTVVANKGKTTGKWQVEFKIGATSPTMLAGILGTLYSNMDGGYLGSVANSIGYWQSGTIYAGDFTGTGGGAAFSANDVLGITLDFSIAGTVKVRFYKNGVVQGGEYSRSSNQGPWFPALTLQPSSPVTIAGTSLQYPVAGFTAWDD